MRDLSCSFPLLLCLLPVEGTGRKQPHSCSGPLSEALEGPASFIVSFHVLWAAFPGDVQRWGPGAGEALLAVRGLPGSHVGLEESAGVAVSPLRNPAGLCLLLGTEAACKQVSWFTRAGSQLNPSLKPAC